MDIVNRFKDEMKEFVEKPRQSLHQVFYFGCIIFSALMLWKGLMLYTGSESPIVVVLSGSMEPGYYRGDILFLNTVETLHTGDVVVFKVDGREIPIVHRIISLYENEEGELMILTKGDNNSVDDRGLYAKNQKWLKKDNVVGTVVGYLPHLGMITIWLYDYPYVKYLTICLMAFFMIFGSE